MCSYTYTYKIGTFVLQNNVCFYDLDIFICHIFSVCISLFKNADLGPLNRIHNPLINWLLSSLENTTRSHSNAPQSYCFSASLKQYRIKAKVDSDTYFCPYSPRPWASYLNSLRFTLLIYNLRMIILTMGKIIVPRPYKAVVRFKWDNLYNIYHSAWHILKYQCYYYPTQP